MRYATPTAEQEQLWKEWLTERPEKVRAVAENFDPWTLYRMKSTEHRVTILSFQEGVESGEVTLTVAVSGEYNYVLFERRVFGISPDDLEECELPLPGEVLGTQMTQEEAHEYLSTIPGE